MTTLRHFFGLYLVLLVLSVSAAFAERTLLEGFRSAKVGDYLVVAQQKNYTLLRVAERNERELTLEEITVPEALFSRQATNWRDWLAAEAPGHTAWALYQVDLQTGKLSGYYSHARNGWVEVSPVEAFFPTLLTLSFEPLSADEQRQLGSAPGQGSQQVSGVWQPPITVEGHRLSTIPLKVWRAVWPPDGSELAGKTIEVYLPEGSFPFPTYFPVWIDVRQKLVSIKIRTIDCGVGLE